MGLKPFHTDALSGLCSKDQLDLLDSIDCLRSQGISHYVSLPQIIVCGDQSSGKSSVLEAISGVSFPVKSNLSTRFPIELVLRKTVQVGVTVSIVPHPSRSDSDKITLNSFHEKLDGFGGLPDLIESAKEAMAISTHGRAFSNDLLRIEVSGPDRPHLTIVDLPGLIHSETKKQSASDVEMVQEVVQAYMREPRSIILAVISAKNDYANQIVLKLARAADKQGNRTLGVITKPDTLIPGSESESTYVTLARNQDVEFRLGWHILKNMDSETGDWSLAERDVKEKDFFAQGKWNELSSSLMGVDKLRKRLSKVLLGQIATELPSLINEIEIKTNACSSQLVKLGEPRPTLDEQRLYLLQTSQSFHSLIKASVDGTYNDSFFGDAKSEPGYHKRIRAVVQNLNLEFAERIVRRGHQRQIVNSMKKAATPKGVTAITREDFMDHIHNLIRRTKGRELPGTFNPMIVSDLFLEQSAPWEAITRNHIEKVWKAAKAFLKLITTYIADAATSKALLQKVFEPALNELLKGLNEKGTKLLSPHQKSHPITYNDSFAEALQTLRTERSKSEYTQIVQEFFDLSTLDLPFCGEDRDLRPLVASLVQHREPDTYRFACSEALDCMEAYYKVALKRFIDDIAVEVIEDKLISPLGNIFSPMTVISMPADLVTQIAGESEENRAQREQLTRQLDVLLQGLETCKRFTGVGTGVVGANEDTTERSRWFDPGNQTSNDEDELYDEESENDVRSLSDSSYGRGGGDVPKEDIVATEECFAIPEEALSEVVEGWGFSTGKKGKKAKKNASSVLFG